MSKYNLTAYQQRIIDRMVDGQQLVRHFPISAPGERWNLKSSWYTLGGQEINKKSITALQAIGLISDGSDSNTIHTDTSLDYVYKLI